MVRSQKQDFSIFAFQNMFHMYNEKNILCSLDLIFFLLFHAIFSESYPGSNVCLPLLFTLFHVLLDPTSLLNI